MTARRIKILTTRKHEGSEPFLDHEGRLGLWVIVLMVVLFIVIWIVGMYYASIYGRIKQ